MLVSSLVRHRQQESIKAEKELKLKIKLKMKNINKISFVGGLVFAIFNAICAAFAAFALQPFVAFWSYIAHVRFTGVGFESSVTLGNVFGGAVGAFVVGYILTWIFVWLHRKFCCEPSEK